MKQRKNKRVAQSVMKFVHNKGRLLAFLAILIGIAVAVAAFLSTPKGRAAANTTDPNSSAFLGELSDNVKRQIEDLNKEKESRTPAQQKIDSQLLFKAKEMRGQRLTESVDKLETDVEVDKDNAVVVDISTRDVKSVERFISRLAKLYPGWTAETVSVTAPNVRARLSLDLLENVATDKSVIFINRRQDAKTSRMEQPMFYGQRYNFSPSFAKRAERVREQLIQKLPQVAARSPEVVNVSEGDKTHKADVARSSFGINGAGIKIGVLSDGVTNLAAAQSTGDIGTVTVLPGQTGSGDEGTAMLELVHDLAPNSQLYFATAFTSITSFAQNVRDLRTAGCDIIIDDVIYFVETPFQDGAPGVTNTNGGVVIQAVADVTAGGALYFSSAGNEGNINDATGSVWEGDFVDGGANALIAGGTVHNFGAGNLNNQITSAGARALLFWSDPLGGATNDYDLYVLNSAASAVVATTNNIQNGTQDPVEDAGNRTSGQRLVVLKKTGGAARFLHVTTFGATMASVTSGTTHGHNQVAAAYSVAAAQAATPFCSSGPGAVAGPFPNPYTAANKVECFSSDGPRRIFYNANSTAITPGNVSSTGGVLRQKPDITAADGTAVTGVGGFPNPFYGTSAAAPHAGAIAALVKSVNPAFTPAQVRGFLNTSAIDIEAAGTDRDSGVGIIMAFEAVQAAGAVPQAFLASGAPVISTGNAQFDPNECNSVTIPVTNSGAVTATNVTAVLSSSSPGVTITQPASTYPNIPSGGTQNNLTPYQVSTSNTIACGTNIALTLTVTYTGGPSPQQQVYNFTVGAPPNYTFASSTGNTIPGVPANGVLVAGSQADDAVVALTVPAGFSFTVYNTVFAGGTSILASTNGNLQLAAAGATAFTNLALPVGTATTGTGTFPASAPSLFPYWDDHDLRTSAFAGGGIYTQLVGSAPTRQWVIEWRGQHFDDTGTAQTIDHAVVFNENSSSFSFYYNLVGGTGGVNPNGSSATIGVQAASTGTQFTQFSFNTANAVSPGTRLTATLSGGCVQGTGTCAPTAADVTVSGRILSSPEGRGVREAKVTLTDENGVSRTILSGPNGSYTFQNVESGRTYVISVASRRFTFSPRVVQIADNISDLDFYPEN